MTERYLPQKLQIPSCISYLVNEVYADPQSEEDIKSKEYEEFCVELKEKKRRANNFCIESKKLASRRANKLTAFLEGVGNDADAECAVRDIEETIEVLALRRTSDACYSLLSGKADFDTTEALSDSEAMMIARERLRLPLFFSKYHFRETIEALDVMPKNWRALKWLKGELLLLFDENNMAEFVGKKLYYSNKRGLETIKEE
jgi:CRISPR-associated endonuclease/helicase Cas3